MLRTLIIICLILSAAEVAAQSVEHWWLPEPYSNTVWYANDVYPVTMYETPGGLLCLSRTDSVYATYQPWRESRWKALTSHRIDDFGTVQSTVLRTIGPLDAETLWRALGGFEFDACGMPDGSELLAFTHWTAFSACVGSDYSENCPLRIGSFDNAGLLPIRTFPHSRKPALIRSASGVAWLAWESITAFNPDQKFLDRHYQSVIRVARFSSAKRMDMTYVIGPGYDPRLVERSDGTVFVVFRTMDHSASWSNVGLRMAALTAPGGGDAIIDGGLSLPFWPTPGLRVFPASDNAIVVVQDRCDSLVAYHCAVEGTVTRSVSPAAGDMAWEFLSGPDGRDILFWRRTGGEDIVWSPREGNRFFTSVHGIDGTAAITKWRAWVGPDGKTKLIFHPAGSGALNVIPNATATDAVQRMLFTPPDDWGAVAGWHLDTKGTLWIFHRLKDGKSHRTGLYRIRDVSLSSGPAALPSRNVEFLPSYPNPFHHTTTIRFVLPNSVPVSIIVTDGLGRVIASPLDHQMLSPGVHNIPFDAGELPPGVYHTRLVAGGDIRIGQLVRLR